jgi:two-component system response regulator DesR
MASVQAPAPHLGLPATLGVEIAASDGLTTERILAVLAAAGCQPSTTPSDAADVLIGAHERADGAVCTEARELGKRSPDTVLVLVVEKAAAGDVRRAVQAGVHAIVIEASIESALVPSIKAALAGQIAIPARVRRGGEPTLLTTREKQILGLIVLGMTNAEIAEKLFLAESTVKSHLSSAFAKLGVSSRSEAASVILDAQSGAGLGILTIPTE